MGRVRRTLRACDRGVRCDWEIELVRVSEDGLAIFEFYAR